MRDIAEQITGLSSMKTVILFKISEQMCAHILPACLHLSLSDYFCYDYVVVFCIQLEKRWTGFPSTLQGKTINLIHFIIAIGVLRESFLRFLSKSVFWAHNLISKTANYFFFKNTFEYSNNLLICCWNYYDGLKILWAFFY